MKKIFFDMDGVLVDFDGYMRESGLTGDEVKRDIGAYLKMEPMPDAIDGIRRVMSIAGQYGYEVWLASKPPTGVPWAYADKVEWVLEHLPELKARIILTHDKGILGSYEDILVDDRPHRANCHDFRGALVHFGPTGTVPHWHALVDLLHRLVRHPSGVKVANAHEREEPFSSEEEVNAARGLMRLGPLSPTIRTAENSTLLASVAIESSKPASNGEEITVSYTLPETAKPTNVVVDAIDQILKKPAHGGYPEPDHAGK